MKFKNNNNPFVALAGIILLLATGAMFIFFGYDAYSTGYMVMGAPGSRFPRTHHPIHEMTGEYAELGGIIFMVLGVVICALSILVYKSYKE